MRILSCVAAFLLIGGSAFAQSDTSGSGSQGCSRQRRQRNDVELEFRAGDEDGCGKVAVRWRSRGR